MSKQQNILQEDEDDFRIGFYGSVCNEKICNVSDKVDDLQNASFYIYPENKRVLIFKKYAVSSINSKNPFPKSVWGITESQAFVLSCFMRYCYTSVLKAIAYFAKIKCRGIRSPIREFFRCVL